MQRLFVSLRSLPKIISIENLGSQGQMIATGWELVKTFFFLLGKS